MRLSEIEKAEQRNGHSSCVCLCLYVLSCCFTIPLLITDTRSQRVQNAAKVALFTHALSPYYPVPFINYNSLYGSKKQALV